MSDGPKLPLDPKDLFSLATGVAVGVGIMVFFVVLAQTMGMTLLVNHGNIPHQ